MYVTDKVVLQIKCRASGLNPVPLRLLLGGGLVCLVILVEIVLNLNLSVFMF